MIWHGFHTPRTCGLAAIVLALSGAPVLAQSGNFELELNTFSDVPDACRLTFVATNGTGVALTETSYEVAVWNASGAVEAILVLEFGELPQSKTRVVQFDLPKLACKDLSRINVNGQDKCEAADGPKDVCIKSLSASSRVPTIAFGL